MGVKSGRKTGRHLWMSRVLPCVQMFYWRILFLLIAYTIFQLIWLLWLKYVKRFPTTTHDIFSRVCNRHKFIRASLKFFVDYYRSAQGNIDSVLQFDEIFWGETISEGALGIEFEIFIFFVTDSFQISKFSALALNLFCFLKKSRQPEKNEQYIFLLFIWHTTSDSIASLEYLE